MGRSPLRNRSSGHLALGQEDAGADRALVTALRYLTRGSESSAQRARSASLLKAIANSPAGDHGPLRSAQGVSTAVLALGGNAAPRSHETGQPTAQQELSIAGAAVGQRPPPPERDGQPARVAHPQVAGAFPNTLRLDGRLDSNEFSIDTVAAVHCSVKAWRVQAVRRLPTSRRQGHVGGGVSGQRHCRSRSPAS